jgi:hypothetical protein
VRPAAPYRTRVTSAKGDIVFTRTKCVLLVSDVTLLRQTFALLLERWTGLRTVQADSPAGGRGLLADLDGDIALAVVSVDTSGGPDTGLIERLRTQGLPVLAFGLQGSKEPLAKALDAGADEAVSLEAPVSYFVGMATQLVS